MSDGSYPRERLTQQGAVDIGFTTGIDFDPRFVECETTDKYYQALTELDHFPRDPSEMPSKMRLSRTLMKDTNIIYMSTMISGDEFSQAAYWDGKNRRYVHEKIRRGNSSDTGVFIEIKRASKDIITFRTPLLEQHGHPNSRKFSIEDVAFQMTYPRTGLLLLAIGENGVSVLATTEKSRKIRQQILRNKKEELLMAKKSWEQFNDADIAKFVEKYGLAYYIWEPKSKLVTPLNFDLGLELSRIKSQN